MSVSATHIEQQVQQGNSSSNQLLARRRTRNSNSTCSVNSQSYDIAPLSIPLIVVSPSRPRCRSNSLRSLQKIERQVSRVAVLCLQLMVKNRFSMDRRDCHDDGSMTSSAELMLQEAADAVIQHSDGDGTPQPAPPAMVASPPQSNGGAIGGGAGASAPRATCRDNERRLARRLVSLADDFYSTRTAQRAVQCARVMDLPPSLHRQEFDSQLSEMLIGVGSIRYKVAILLIVCAEMATRAITLCHRVALLTLLSWGQEVFCGLASAFVAMQGWNSMLKDDPMHSRALGPMALVLTVLIFGCTIGTVLHRHCR